MFSGEFFVIFVLPLVSFVSSFAFSFMYSSKFKIVLFSKINFVEMFTSYFSLIKLDNSIANRESKPNENKLSSTLNFSKFNSFLI